MTLTLADLRYLLKLTKDDWWRRCEYDRSISVEEKLTAMIAQQKGQGRAMPNESYKDFLTITRTMINRIQQILNEARDDLEVLIARADTGDRVSLTHYIAQREGGDTSMAAKKSKAAPKKPSKPVGKKVAKKK